MTQEKQPILEMQSVSVSYNGHAVLEDINLVVREQDFLGVIGTNGSGKTTLVRVIMGLLKPVSGTIRLFGKPMQKSRNPIGYLPQQSMFDKKFPITVGEVVLSGLASTKGLFRSFSKEDHHAAHNVMEQMGITALAHRALGTLSGGQLQRAFLARALVSQPPLLILDEPNTFVDQSFSRAFHEILVELNQRMAIILVSHDLGMISSHVKTIACVNRNLYYHHSNIIDKKLLDTYNCPLDLITHGDLPHRVLDKHNCKGDHSHA